MIDLRSDTLTVPTEGMRAAMAAADVGDDVYGEDPTVNALQEEVAGLFGHEAALFVPSGTMGNQLCVRLLVAPGEELLCDADAHVVTYEHGAAAAHGGISTRTWNAVGGRLDVATVETMVRPAGYNTVPTRAVAVENTHNRGGGTVQPLAALRALRRLADDTGISLHCDGARIWNAHIATGVPLADYGALFDTLSVCLSKGLGAPVGSLLVSSAERIAAARGMRKRLGGGMRQAGVLAAAGRYALAHHLERLTDDHARAGRLAELLGVDPSTVDTNIVSCDMPDAPALADKARGDGLLLSVVGPRRMRLVTHLGVEDADIERAGELLHRLMN
ncbi:MAG: aminotransferase class I/II-fold pyridoxal phosphate-dependent enzyme [Actinomycetota bacterium]|nr:aminotransferase class I/II-fold pyridoxal phosphate-dependent enzyme [Actinomycetota bacterium]